MGDVPSPPTLALKTAQTQDGIQQQNAAWGISERATHGHFGLAGVVAYAREACSRGAREFPRRERPYYGNEGL